MKNKNKKIQKQKHTNLITLGNVTEENIGKKFLPHGIIQGGDPVSNEEKIRKQTNRLFYFIEKLEGGELFKDGFFVDFCQEASLFLRLLLLDKYRLLSDTLIEDYKIKFHKICSPEDVKTINLVNDEIQSGFVEFRAVDEPGKTERVLVKPFRNIINIDFPLLGINYKKISNDLLFDEKTEPTLTLKQWLDSLILIVNGESISLERAIKSVVNSEKVHITPNSATINNDIRTILTSMKICNNFCSYNHLIVGLTTIYLIKLLIQHSIIKNVKTIDIKLDLTPNTPNTKNIPVDVVLSYMILLYKETPNLLPEENKIELEKRKVNITVPKK